MKQSRDNKNLLSELRDLLDDNANILADSYIRRLGGKLTILYLRLSREDKVQGDIKEESNSIVNQRIYLTNYAQKNKFKNVMVFYDDGISGVTFERNDFKKVLRLIELGMVENLIVKNLSRLGREHIRTDTLLEIIFPKHNVRFISVERSAKYDDEQIELKSKIKNLETIVYEEKSHELNVDAFLQRVHKYSDIKELTSEILHEFIDKVVVHHREQIHGQTVQKVEIYHKIVGKIEIPNMSKKEKEQYLKIFGSDKKIA